MRNKILHEESKAMCTSGRKYARQREEQVRRPRDKTQLGMSEAQYRGWRVNHTVGGNEAGEKEAGVSHLGPTGHSQNLGVYSKFEGF